MPGLIGKVCLVTGASRGIGRGVALQLVTHGATCYITGRKMKDLKLVEDEIKSRGVTGTCISVVCDHSCDNDVENLFKQIGNEQNGQLDLLVNNAFAGVKYIADNGKVHFWDQDPIEGWDKINGVGLRSNYICAVYASRLMVPKRKGLIINISSTGGKLPMFMPQYGVGKAGNDRMARDCAFELSKYNVAFLSLWPGLVKTELFAQSEENNDSMKDIVEKFAPPKDFFSEAETPEFVGKAIVYLLADAKIINRSGQIVFTTDLGSEFDFNNVDGSTPSCQRSIRLFLKMSPSPWNILGNYIPYWLKIPRSIYFMLLELANSLHGPPKNPSKYE